ncbi:MAG: peroxiredoxin family protein [Acidimicrobiales bacterium]
MDLQTEFPPAPPLAVSQWFNIDTAISLDDLAGQVVAIEAFQILCPGCVSHGLPQAQRIAGAFAGEVTVLGLHTVFEHHDAMGPVSLAAFLHEYRIGFPVGVDTHDHPGGTPITMARYQLRGTPSLILIDRAGRVRLNAFGHVDDLAVGATLARLIDEPPPTTSGCDTDQGSTVPTKENTP